MKIQLKKGVLEMCVLSVLARGDSYAYEIVSTLSSTMGISEGTIYPLMRRLEAEQFVSTYLSQSSNGPARKYYSLTESGRLALRQMQREWQEFVGDVEQVIQQGIAK
ncbi:MULTISPECIES: PadR family transcriptional regulator [Chitinibacter]|uniref:PadR family transcriptional regulator n=1 Tax=Chitinibacter TaxID=230666 RepID=UPI0003FEAC0E|nr:MULTISPECIES: PadR family transcriptional regulator [Chitinibacter]